MDYILYIYKSVIVDEFLYKEWYCSECREKTAGEESSLDIQ